MPTPSPLRRTGRIAVAAPASAPLDDARYRAGLDALRARGLRVETPRATFAEHGYALAGLRAFDLFPQTHHVECVATLVPSG